MQAVRMDAVPFKRAFVSRRRRSGGLGGVPIGQASGMKKQGHDGPREAVVARLWGS